MKKSTETAEVLWVQNAGTYDIEAWEGFCSLAEACERSATDGTKAVAYRQNGDELIPAYRINEAGDWFAV